MPRPLVFDRWLFVTTALLVIFGLFMVGSASFYLAVNRGEGPVPFLSKLVVHVVVALAAFAVALRFPYGKLDDERWVWTMIGVSLFLLLVVLAMPPVGGARRWFRLGPFAVQPSEFAKLAVVVFMAHVLSRRENQVNDLSRVPLPAALAIGPLVLLIVVEPDLGSAAMLAMSAFVMIFVAGLRWKYIGTLAGVGLLGFVVAVIAEPYRVTRLKIYVESLVFGSVRDTLGAGFQLTQSLIAVGSGGITGAGWGRGQQKAFFLPAAHTDFIFSVIGEELGFLGVMLLLGAFLVVFWRGIRTANRAPDRFGFYLSLGITSMLVLQAMIHMGVCLGLLPTKGLPLPLISHGGSSLVATMAAVGVLLNVSQHSN